VTRTSDGEEALCISNLASAVTGIAILRLRTWGGAGALTSLATLETRNTQLRGHPVCSVFESDFQVVTKIGPTLRRGASRTTAPATKHIAKTKQIAKYVFDAAETRRAPGTRTSSTARNARMSEPIVALPLLGIRQHAISLGCFLELLFR